MLTDEMKERKAVGLAEIAWGQIIHWHRAGKLQGDLTYEEFRKVLEPLFREAFDLPPGPGIFDPGWSDHDSAQG